MIDLTKYFTKDETTYHEKGIVVFDFDESLTTNFLNDFVEDFRRAYVSDEQLNYDVTEKIFDTREEAIKSRLPTLPYLKSGEFGEILYFYIAQTYLAPDADVIPIKWQWKESCDTPCHLSDIVLLKCLESTTPQPSDYMFTMEIKTLAKALPRRTTKSIMNNAIKGAIKDRISRAGKLVNYLRINFSNSHMPEMALKVKRFAEGEKVIFQKRYCAAILVDRGSLDKHIKNITEDNLQNSQANSIALFAIPMSTLKNKYEQLFDQTPIFG